MKLRLREARKLKGLTLQEAADQLMVSKQYLSKVEINGVNADSKLLIKYSNLYGVTIDYLIPNKHRPKIELEIIHICKSIKNI